MPGMKLTNKKSLPPWVCSNCTPHISPFREFMRGEHAFIYLMFHREKACVCGPVFTVRLCVETRYLKHKWCFGQCLTLFTPVSSGPLTVIITLESLAHMSHGPDICVENAESLGQKQEAINLSCSRHESEGHASPFSVFYTSVCIDRQTSSNWLKNSKCAVTCRCMDHLAFMWHPFLC